MMKTWSNRYAFDRYRFELDVDAEWHAIRNQLAGVPTASVPPRGTSSQAIVDMRAVEVDLHRQLRTAIVTLIRAWTPKYRHRRDAIRGHFPTYAGSHARSRLADVAAQQALIQRHRRRDAAAAARDLPMPSGIGVKSAEEMHLHAYGPSLRALWTEALLAGLSEREAWQHAMEWAVRPAPVHPTDDPAPALTERMRRKAGWRCRDDRDFPWTAEADGEAWRVRLNDFPDEPMYRLFVGDQSVADFHDWPKPWHRLDDPSELALPIVKPPRKGNSAAPGALSNQAAFDAYRRRSEVELWDVKAWLMIAEPDYERVERHFRDTLLARLARYRRRQATIDGDEALADVAARQALIARNRRRDAAAITLPDWDLALKILLYEAAFRFKKNSADERRLLADFVPASLAELHDYGPSIRWLWTQAKALGLCEPDAWRHVVAWAVHRPAAWQAVDRPAALIERLEQDIRWRNDGDPDHPWTASVDGGSLRVRLNDFPDEPMYGLMVGDRHLGDFHDWPRLWHRG
jgi:hypothetical protein